jgi:leucyl aminopeptidase
LTLLTKAGLAAWRENAPARERDWAAATGFTGEPGKLALVPGESGQLGHVLVGSAEDDAAMWALAGLSETLPEGNYRLEKAPKGGDPSHVALGWALGTYGFTRYHEKPAGKARLVWPKGAEQGLV